MNKVLQLFWAFLQRDFKSQNALMWIFDWLNVGLWVILWYFITKIFRVSGIRSAVSDDYFAFSLIGLALTQYIWRGFSTFTIKIKKEQACGLLEFFWLAPYPFLSIIAISCIWDFVAATINAGMALVIGVLGFGVKLRWNGILEIMGIGFLTSLAMGSLGLLSASWSLMSGRGDFLRPFLARTLPLLSGAFFPIVLFPEWLKWAAWCFPFTHALILSRSILMNTPNIELTRVWFAFLGTTITFIITSCSFFSYAVHQSRINGRISAA